MVPARSPRRAGWRTAGFHLSVSPGRPRSRRCSTTFAVRLSVPAARPTQCARSTTSRSNLVAVLPSPATPSSDRLPTSSSNFARVRLTIWDVSVADLEGLNGLDYRSSGDPRTRTTLQTINQFGQGIYHPDAYASDGGSPIVLASGVEARLIEAEAALEAGDAGWLATLNALRTDGTYDTQPDPADSTQSGFFQAGVVVEWVGGGGCGCGDGRVKASSERSLNRASMHALESVQRVPPAISRVGRFESIVGQQS